MKTVLAILSERGHRERVRVFLDDGPSLTLTRLTLAERSIHVGRTFSDEEFAEIVAGDTRQTAFDTALNFLSHRPRSEAEIRQRLGRSRFTVTLIDETLDRLRAHNLVNDEAFTEFWVASREASHPRSQFALKQELRAKGVEQEIVQDAIAGVDEDDGAYRLARKRGASLRDLEYPEFRKRLGSFLQRHGYRYGIASKTVARVWEEELHGEANGDDEAPGEPDDGD